MKRNKTRRGCSFTKVFGVMLLEFLTMVSITGAAPFAYITNSGNNSVSVIDISTDIVTATVDVGDTPDGVAVTPDGTETYVSNRDSNTISMIDTATNTVTATVKVGVSPRGIAFTPDGVKAYVANYGDNTISVIDTETSTIVVTINAGDGPFGVAVTPDGTKVYVSNANRNTISVIDTATNTVTATVEVGPWPCGFGQFIVPASQSKDNSTVIVSSNTTSNSTDKGTEAGTLIKPKNGTQDLEQNNITTVANVEQMPEMTQSTSTPGFEAIGLIVSLLVVVLRKEIKKGN